MLGTFGFTSKANMILKRVKSYPFNSRFSAIATSPDVPQTSATSPEIDVRSHVSSRFFSLSCPDPQPTLDVYRIFANVSTEDGTRSVPTGEVDEQDSNGSNILITVSNSAAHHLAPHISSHRAHL